MSSLRNQLTMIFADAFEQCGLAADLGEVVVSQRSDLGDYQCNGALMAAQEQKSNPRGLAETVIQQVDCQEICAEVSIAGPGFINIRVADDFLATHLQTIAQDERLGCPVASPTRRIVIDFGGPNVAKPMHVGHLRSTIIGDCLQRLCRFLGHQVTSDIHLGDWGTPMGMLIGELERRQPDLPYFEPAYTGPYPQESPVTITDLQAMYPQAVTYCQADESAKAAALEMTVALQQGRPGYRALWQHFVAISKADLKADFDNLGVTFDLWLGESDYHDYIPSLLERLRAAEQAQLSDGAWVIPLAEIDQQRPLPPLILVKSDGGFLYGTTDLATIEQRVDEFQADEILYVVDARQSLHFQQLFQAARQTGLAQETVLKHIAFGTVNGPDGKPFKTRAGGTMPLKVLIAMVTDEAFQRMAENNLALDYSHSERLTIAQQVGLAALKFADLINHRTSDYTFDAKRFTKFEGRTGPYLLYTGVRIKSILREAAQRGLAIGPLLPPTTPSERALMLSWPICPMSSTRLMAIICPIICVSLLTNWPKRSTDFTINVTF